MVHNRDTKQTTKNEENRNCKTLPKPDIMTAYHHVGESLSELYNCNDGSINSHTKKGPQNENT